MSEDRYFQPHQARKRPPTGYESLLGDAIERAFAADVHDLAGLVKALNEEGMLSPAGVPWTEDSYGIEMAKLANQ